MKKKIKVLGIMNGTSLDAIDYCLLEVDEKFKNMKFIKHWQKNIPQTLKKQLLSAARNESTTYDVSQLHYQLGKLYGKHIKTLKKNYKWDCVGLHGQTVHHLGKVASLQIGHPGFIHQECQKPVYFDFRSNDIIAGGQGAPLAPFFQKKLAQQMKLSKVAFHNLGGISNTTVFLPKNQWAFDTGPANILIDAWIQAHTSKNYDENGRLASQGLPNPLVVEKMLKDPFFSKKPPKSTGREDFNISWIKSWGSTSFKKLNLNDQLATLTDLTALSVAKTYQQLKTSPRDIFFYGGGIYNTYLMERIQFYLPDHNIQTTDDLGWPSQAFEAAIFGFLAAARFYNKKVHLHTLTGAKSAQLLGSLYC